MCIALWSNVCVPSTSASFQRFSRDEANFNLRLVWSGLSVISIWVGRPEQLDNTTLMQDNPRSTMSSSEPSSFCSNILCKDTRVLPSPLSAQGYIILSSNFQELSSCLPDVRLSFLSHYSPSIKSVTHDAAFFNQNIPPLLPFRKLVTL